MAGILPAARLRKFRKLLGLILSLEEREVPHLEASLDDLLDELEAEPGTRKYDRAAFQRYPIVPNTTGR